MIKKIFVLFSIILLIGIVSSATYYVTDPTSCLSSDGTNFPGQNCAPQDICGDIGGIAQCYDTSTISPPGSPSTTTGSGGTDYSCTGTACSGGFITNCYATTNCLTALCDRNPTCYNKHTQTTCTASSWATSSCSATCTTNYFACDGDTTDADGCEIQAGASCGSGTGTIVNNQCYSSSAGNCTSSTRYDCDNDDSDSNLATCNGANGCEILGGGACSVGSLTGTYSGCTCVVSKSYFQTGTFIEYLTNSTQSAMLWFKNYFANGFLINATTNAGKSFIVDNETNIITEGSLTIKGNTISNGTATFSLQDLNATGSGEGDNSSWNQSYANTLYAGIKWDYNQTLASFEYFYNKTSNINATGYNITADYLFGDGSGLTGLLTASTIDFQVQVSELTRKGQAVYILSGISALPNVALARANISSMSRVVGIATANIATVGTIRRNGVLTNVDTRTSNTYVNCKAETWIEGDLLFLDNNVSGCLTKNRPTSGRSVKVAYSLKGNSNTDSLLVYPMENPVWTTGASGENITLRMGDNGGLISIRNYTDFTVAKIDSSGNLTLNGGALIQNNVNITKNLSVGRFKFYDNGTDLIIE